MRAQFVRGIDPKNSMKLGHFDPKTKKVFLAGICQEMMSSLQNLIKEKNLDAKVTPGFSFDGPIEEWKTEADLRIKHSEETYFLMWDNEKYVAGVSGNRFIRSEHNNLSDAINQIKKLLI